VIKQLFHYLREKERNLEFLPYIFLIFKMKLLCLTVLACNLHLREMGQAFSFYMIRSLSAILLLENDIHNKP